MFEKITLRIFLICLVTCASMILFGIWTSMKPAEVYFKTVATFFIFGLGSFLFWFVSIVYSLRSHLRGLNSIR